MKASSFEVVAKFVEFVQIVSADAALLISDSINSAHFFHLPLPTAHLPKVVTHRMLRSSRVKRLKVGPGFIGEWMEGESL